VFGCGRCDLRGGDPEQMFQTLGDMRAGLPTDTVILPGHNYAEKTSSTLGEQLEGNPFMHFDDLDRFVRYRMQYHDKHRHGPYGPVSKGQEMPA
jgi:glyoxylase-like metal-dependent hydrolase (beta-lactamase superfamily II)